MGSLGDTLVGDVLDAVAWVMDFRVAGFASSLGSPEKPKGPDGALLWQRMESNSAAGYRLNSYELL